MSVFSPRPYDPVAEHLDQAFELLVKQPPRKRSLRCSGLPYCNILDAIVPDEPEYADLKSALFTSMGTAAHSAIQLFMTLAPMGEDVWGSWSCINCKKELKYQFRPPDCCNLPMHYDEVDLRVGPLTGHIDLVVRYNSKWIVYEFKTTGPEPEKPKRQHQLQIRHYVAMLKMNFGIDVTGYTVVYVERKFLERYQFGPYNAQGSIQETRDMIFNAIKSYKTATKVRRDPSPENIFEMIKQRPCKSAADWKNYMSRKHDFLKTDCPLLYACTKGNAACLKAVNDLNTGNI